MALKYEDVPYLFLFLALIFPIDKPDKHVFYQGNYPEQQNHWNVDEDDMSHINREVD